MKETNHQQTVRPYTLGATTAVIICPSHLYVPLTSEEYMVQLANPDSFWKCPICGSTSDWDEDNYDVWAAQNMGSWQECEVCNGSGVVTCKRCNGSGWVGGLTGEICCDGNDDCSACNGAGGAWVRQEM